MNNQTISTIALKYKGEKGDIFYRDGCKNYEWCAAFVSYILQKCNIYDRTKTTDSCNMMISFFKNEKIYHTIFDTNFDDINVDDVVFYNWDNDNLADHVGIVVEKGENYIKVIEGNIGNDNCTKSYVDIRYVPKNYSYLFGYAKTSTKQKITNTTVNGIDILSNLYKCVGSLEQNVNSINATILTLKILMENVKAGRKNE